MKRDNLRLLVGIAAFGALWGMLEATLGGALALIRFPHFGGTMANIGFIVMAAALATYGRPGMQLGIGGVAASFKLLNVPLFGVSPLAKMIVNPMVAIILQALAFELVVGPVWRRLPRNTLVWAGAGALAIFLAYVGQLLAFSYLTRQVPQFILADPWGWVLRNGGFAAVLALVSVPLGLGLGGLLRRAEGALALRPQLYYLGGLGFALLCLAAAVWGMLT